MIRYCGACQVGFSVILIGALLRIWKKKKEDKAG